MLKTNTAYPITPTNGNVLSHLSGRPLKELVANVGWCATYSESRYPRWMIVPTFVALQTMEFEVDAVAYP